MITIKYDGFLLTDPDQGYIALPPEDFGAPPVRGQDLAIPFRHGALPVKKYYDSRVIVINGYVKAPERQTLWKRIDRVKQICSIAEKGPRKLEFIWPDGTTRYLWAEPRNTLGFVGTHITFSPFSIEFQCADPFWHDDGAAQEKPYRLNDPQRLRLGDPRLLIADFDASYDAELTYQSTTLQVPNFGIVPIDDAILKLTFRANAQLTDLTIRCPSSGTALTVLGQFNWQDVLVIDCIKWQATLNHTDITDRMITGPGQRGPLIIPVGLIDIIFSFVSGAVFDIRLSAKYSARYL